MARRDYPEKGMYDQAHRIYLYIYAHPQYLRDDTRINHGRILLKAGKQSEAFHVLSRAARVYEAKDPPEEQRSDHLRRLGTIYTLLQQNDRADDEFNKAIDIDQQQLASTSKPNKKSKLLWSIARTMEARGDVTAAIEKAKQARETAIFAELRFTIKKWIWAVENEQSVIY